MPANNIQRAIDRGSGKLGGDQIQEVLYEGYGPGGTAVLVECATDNINRTYPAVRLAFTKHGGNIAEKGAVAFQFEGTLEHNAGIDRIFGDQDSRIEYCGHGVVCRDGFPDFLKHCISWGGARTEGITD